MLFRLPSPIQILLLQVWKYQARYIKNSQICVQCRAAVADNATSPFGEPESRADFDVARGRQSCACDAHIVGLRSGLDSWCEISYIPKDDTCVKQ